MKDYFGFALASDYTSDGFTTASVCSSACSWIYAGSAELSTGSGHTVVHHLGKCGLLEVETAALFLARFILPVMEKHGLTQVQVEIGVHAIIIQQ